MTDLKNALASVIAEYGESATASGSAIKGVFRPISPTEARTFMLSADVDATARPILRGFVAPEVVVAKNDVWSVQGISYYVQHVRTIIVRAVAIIKVVVLTEVLSGGPS